MVFMIIYTLIVYFLEKDILMKKVILFLLMLLMVACQPNGPLVPEQEPPQPTSETDSASELDNNEPTMTPEPETSGLELVISGPEEVVFDWTTDHCEDENIPDIAARAFRDADGMVQLTIGHYVGYRMVGPDLDHLEMDCSGPINESDFDSDPAMFNDAEWIGSLYTEDGQTVYAVMHNEYRGHLHGAERPDQCPSGNYLTCLDTSLTMSISTDGGATYHDIAEPPNHLIATLPYVFDDQGVPSGLRQPTLIKGQDGYFYIFSNISDYPTEVQWACVIRTDNLDDPSSWRYWDGRGFNGQFVNPYTQAVDKNTPTCARLPEPALAAGLVESLTYNTVLEKYIAVGISFHPVADQPAWGVYYSYSDDLLHWSMRRLLIELPINASVNNPDTDMMYAYPTLIDPDSPSINFDTTDNQMYLYMTLAHFGGGSLDRDLVRYPVELAPITYEAPQWKFEIDGNVEGWVPENDITDFNVSGGVLSMQSSGEGPYLVTPPLEFPASDYGQINITMKISPGESTIGQVFFITDLDKEFDEAKSLVFDVISDGEFHTYNLLMSSVSGWQGLIQQLRFDPVVSSGRTIEIDKITVEPVQTVVPEWDFETDSYAEGWMPQIQLIDFNVSNGVLSMRSSGNDPYLVSAPVQFSADENGQLRITMKVSSGESTVGQVFFTTDLDKDFNEAKSLVFDVISDGEFHTYDLDMSTVSGWRGLITQIRIDPVASEGRTIEIDRIAIEP